MLLEEDERRRFAEYCSLNAKSNRGLAEQMKKISTPAVVTQMYEKKAEAYEIVAKDLLAVEIDTVGR